MYGRCGRKSYADGALGLLLSFVHLLLVLLIESYTGTEVDGSGPIIVCPHDVDGPTNGFYVYGYVSIF